MNILLKLSGIAFLLAIIGIILVFKTMTEKPHNSVFVKTLSLEGDYQLYLHHDAVAVFSGAHFVGRCILNDKDSDDIDALIINDNQ